MGGDRVTVRNLKVVQVDADNNLLVVRGAIPGSPGQGRIDTDAIRLEKLYTRLENMLEGSHAAYQALYS